MKCRPPDPAGLARGADPELAFAPRQLAHFEHRELRAIVSTSEAAEKVALVNLQLFELRQRGVLVMHSCAR